MESLIEQATCSGIINQNQTFRQRRAPSAEDTGYNIVHVTLKCPAPDVTELNTDPHITYVNNYLFLPLSSISYLMFNIILWE